MTRRAWVVRWIATIVALVVCAIAAILPPFGCAVGEYEEDNPSCDTPTLQFVAFGVLIAGVILARLTRRPAFQWAGIAASVVLALVGLDKGV